MPRVAGRHFLQIPGPTNVPDRILRAIDQPTMDHRGPEFAQLGKFVLAGMKRIFRTDQGEVVIYPASGTGAWEAALVNTLSPGDLVLMAETGQFATLWQRLAGRLHSDVAYNLALACKLSSFPATGATARTRGRSKNGSAPTRSA